MKSSYPFCPNRLLMSETEQSRCSAQLEVRNQYGIHARPAALIVKLAGKYISDVFLEHNGNRVSAKSIMGLLTIEGHHGALLKVTAHGEDAKDAIQALTDLFESKFDED